MLSNALLSLVVLSASLSLAFASSADTSKVQQKKITNYPDDTKMYAGTTFVVALQVDAPFVFYDNRSNGNDRFSGITIDILNLIALKLECSLVFELADPKELESLNAPLKAIGGYSNVGDRHWADIGAGAIPITANRSLQVHFTQPYYDTGFVVVVKRPQKVFSIWSLLRPFANEVWALVAVEILICGLCLCIMEGPSFFRGQESDVASGILPGLADAIYWSCSTFTATMHMAPRSWAGKLVMIAHGFFLVIIINSYVANLASVLTATTLAPTIAGWPDITDSNGAYKLAIPRGQAQSDFLEAEAFHYGHEFNVVETDEWEDSMEMVLAGQADATFLERASAQFYLAKVLAQLSTYHRAIYTHTRVRSPPTPTHKTRLLSAVGDSKRGLVP
jgi:ABC-type amino acid transport substrate-binding protein